MMGLFSCHTHAGSPIRPTRQYQSIYLSPSLSVRHCRYDTIYDRKIFPSQDLEKKRFFSFCREPKNLLGTIDFCSRLCYAPTNLPQIFSAPHPVSYSFLKLSSTPHPESIMKSAVMAVACAAGAQAFVAPRFVIVWFMHAFLAGVSGIWVGVGCDSGLCGFADS